MSIQSVQRHANLDSLFSGELVLLMVDWAFNGLLYEAELEDGPLFTLVFLDLLL